MYKHKKITKIIIGTLMISLVFSFVYIQKIPEVQASNELNWDNPNKNGDNPYKINTDAILNSSTMMQVVGCTGLVDTVTTWTTNFLKKQGDKLIKKWEKKQAQKAKTKACEAFKASFSGGLSLLPNVTISGATIDKIDCKKVQATEDTETTDAVKEQTAKVDATKKREECFNGLAYTLAKNQLTSMTKQTVNWVNSGFNGNPMYVQNITSLTDSIEKNVLESGIEELSNGAFPYGRDFSRSLITNYNTGGIKNSSNDFLESLTSDLANFVTDDNSWTNYDISSDKTAQMKIAQQANDTYANDFSTGGWDGWLALTQKDQNNPLGFTMMASQYLSNKIDQQTTETKEETAQNNGFLSQKECTSWREYDESGPVKYPEWDPETDTYTWTYNDRENKGSDYDQCVDWKIVTPGSIIKDKLTTYINSPERQLELADTINESLNNLFTTLIEKFRDEGLFGLSQDKYVYDNSNMGVSGYITPNYSDINSIDETSGFSGSFDLTRDLGNTYLHESTTYLGKWDAKNNIPELHIGLGPYDEISKGYYPSNVYYTVSIPGNTQLFYNGYNSWAVGDRVFWDGSEWQDWKCQAKGLDCEGAKTACLNNQTDKNLCYKQYYSCIQEQAKNKNGICTNQTSPISKRGIIQTQKDYVVAAKEILKVLPGIMPKLGELDYCIPGPNPYFQENSGDTAGVFSEYAGSLNSIYKDGSFFKRDTTTFSIAKPGNTEYDNYVNIFKKDSDNNGDIDERDEYQDKGWWESIKETLSWRSLQQLGNIGEEKKDRSEEKIQNTIYSLVNQIQKDIKDFYVEYNKSVFKGIYGTILTEFVEKENKNYLEDNPGYIPMAQDGYNLTKEMLSYDEDINTAVEDYNTAIVQAESNTKKLDNIKNDVSKIIKAAQERRDAALLEKIKKDKCNTAYNKCISNSSVETNDNQNMTLRVINKVEAVYYDNSKCEEEYNKCISAPVTEADKAAYKSKYADCFDEEDISYYNDTDIMTDNGGDGEVRCSDGIDNDLDGLIDARDPDCKNNSYQPTYYCTTDPSRQYDTNDDPGLDSGDIETCGKITNKESCLNENYQIIISNDPTKYRTFGCRWISS